MARLVEDHYVLKGRAPSIAAAIREHGAQIDAALARVAVDDDEPRQRVNQLLRRLAGDGHLGLWPLQEDGAWPATGARELAAENGFQRVERLPGYCGSRRTSAHPT